MVRSRVVTIKMTEDEVEKLDAMAVEAAKQAAMVTGMPMEISRSSYLRNLILEALVAREVG